MRSRKGQMVSNLIMWIPRLLYIIFEVGSIVFLISHFLVVSIDVQPAQGTVLTNRFLYSSNCFAYIDQKLSRPYPGIVDISKFNAKQMDSCVSFGSQNDYAAAHFVLRYLDTDEIVSFKYNEFGYDALEPRAGMAGSGGAIRMRSTHYILVRQDTKVRPAYLVIDLLSPRY